MRPYAFTVLACFLSSLDGSLPFIMTSKSFLHVAILFLLGLAAATSPQANGATPGEKAKIEALITHLEALTDATFVRNGSEYKPKSAAKFLRKKWQANESEIPTAAAFIEKVATASSTTGKPYLIRFKGTEKKCADYLKEQLQKLESP